MLKKIEHIKSLGIFSDYSHATSLKEFNKFNLFYGCNGSGKSTLATLFRDIELKRKSILFPESQWKVIGAGGDIDNGTVENNNLNIRVFNKEFVEANVFTPSGVKGIVYISEQSGEDKKLLDDKIVKLEETKKEHKKISDLLDGIPEDKKSKGLKELNDIFLSDAAKRIKAQFKVIEIQDNRLLNYDKSKLRNFINDYTDQYSVIF